MALDAVIFDIDGTLVDSNPAHVEAWVAAFARLGYRIAADRVSAEIGKGGDKLVPSILGRAADRKDGDALRKAQTEEFLRLAGRTRLPVLPRAEELFAELRRRGIRTALATSSSGEQLDGLFRSAGTDFRKLADQSTSADDAEESKPAPDIVQASVARLALAPTQCAMVGDTVFDAEACRGAGVACLGVRSGGNDVETLMRAGTRGVWRDTGDLLDHLDEALSVAAPGPVPVDQPLLDSLMREALAAAREGLAAGDAPIGAVLARGDGTVIGRGWNRMATGGIRTAHAEMAAFDDAGARIPVGARDLLLVSTLEPCVMCTGAAMQTAVDVIAYGLRAPADAGTGRVAPPRSPDNGMPRIVGGILADESRALFEEWLRVNGNPEQRPYVEQLLQSTS
jgi:beta-phosphoglucomutase-like phosphatase (HAD superfamily)/tRNA(Arg) A34 adenosine deaminase TadA